MQRLLAAVALALAVQGCASRGGPTSPGSKLTTVRERQAVRPVPQVDYDVVSIMDHYDTCCEPIRNAHVSTFVGRVKVARITDAVFNTDDGDAPDDDFESFDMMAYTSPFTDVDDAYLGPDVTIGPDEAKRLDAIEEQWIADGMLMTPFGITRLAVLDVDTVYKGDPDMDKVVVILQGGIAAARRGPNSGKVFEYPRWGLDELDAGDEVLMFATDLVGWRLDHARNYPAIQRCLDTSDRLDGFGTVAQCLSLVMTYEVRGLHAHIPLAGSTPRAVREIETQVAVAVATVPTESSQSWTEMPWWAKMDWQTPTPGSR